MRPRALFFTSWPLHRNGILAVLLLCETTIGVIIRTVMDTVLNGKCEKQDISLDTYASVTHTHTDARVPSLFYPSF